MERPKILSPVRVESYRGALEDAYAAYGKIETVVDALGQESNYQRTRLDDTMKKYGT